MVVACHIILKTARRGCNFILGMLQYIVQLALMRDHANLSQRDQKLMSDFPGDIRSILEQFYLDGRSTIYAVCPNPKCHCTYKPTFDGVSPIPQYPMYCTHRECEERILRPRRMNNVEIQVPIKRFVYFDFKDWVAGLLSRPSFEEHMDAAWDAMAQETSSGEMHDIFDGSVLKDFQGPDGKHFRFGGEEGRYVFSLCVDFFNPLGNKQAGKKYSMGIISLVCLNLPPDMRYKPENMFMAGVVPGPKEPPLTTLNHYLTPLVDDFLEFWKPGVYFSRTRKYSLGRLVRCALVAVVCDLLGARKVAGFASCTHEHFCAICHCTRSAHGYGNTDYSSWRYRTQYECKMFADRYNNASDEKTRQGIFDAAGLRWSELLRLPYFDLARYVVVDAMHNLFLGLIKEHFQGILGIGAQKDKDETVLSIKFSDELMNLSITEQKSVNRLKGYLESPMNDRLTSDRETWLRKFSQCNLSALEFVCKQLGCPHPPEGQKIAKKDWAESILHWVSASRVSSLSHS
jgi:Transposase family tnp2